VKDPVVTLPSRKSVRVRKPTEKYVKYKNNNNFSGLATDIEPKTYEEAVSGKESEKWILSMQEEIASLIAMHTWDLVEPIEGRKVISTKWVYKIKYDPNGQKRYKSRLVAKGFTQKPGIDYNETFSPVVRFDTIRLMLALCAINNWEAHHVDVKTAFLNGVIDEEIYIEQPQGFAVSQQVCLLKRSLYGLKQSPRLWNSTFFNTMTVHGFEQSKNDSCLFFERSTHQYLLLYVDDIILFCPSKSVIERTKNLLRKHFEITDLGEISKFLGVTIERNRVLKTLKIHQADQILKLLEQHSMLDCNGGATPMEPKRKVIEPIPDEGIKDQYQQIVGSLIYLSVVTRLDIAYSVMYLTRYMHSPSKEQFVIAKRVLRYLKTTPTLGIVYGDQSPDITGYTDADWAADAHDRKSVSGYLFVLAGGPITWKSKKQSVVALSTMESEYIAACTAAQESVWLMRLIAEITSSAVKRVTLFEDNNACIALSSNPISHARSKHIDIRFHYLRECVSNGWVQLVKIPTDKMLADILTKPLHAPKFVALRDALNMTSGSVRMMP